MIDEMKFFNKLIKLVNKCDFTNDIIVVINHKEERTLYCRIANNENKKLPKLYKKVLKILKKKK